MESSAGCGGGESKHLFLSLVSCAHLARQKVFPGHGVSLWKSFSLVLPLSWGEMHLGKHVWEERLQSSSLQLAVASKRSEMVKVVLPICFREPGYLLFCCQGKQWPFWCYGIQRYLFRELLLIFFFFQGESPSYWFNLGFWKWVLSKPYQTHHS